MAKLRTFRSLSNQVYKVRFENDPNALTNEDKSLMEDFGEPEINLGGTFEYDDGVTQFTYELPDEFAKVRSDFPIAPEFDSRVTPWDTDTQKKVNFYESTIASRFSDAFVALRAKRPAADSFTGETIYNV